MIATYQNKIHSSVAESLHTVKIVGRRRASDRAAWPVLVKLDTFGSLAESLPNLQRLEGELAILEPVTSSDIIMAHVTHHSP